MKDSTELDVQGIVRTPSMSGRCEFKGYVPTQSIQYLTKDGFFFGAARMPDGNSIMKLEYTSFYLYKPRTKKRTYTNIVDQRAVFDVQVMNEDCEKIHTLQIVFSQLAKAANFLLKIKRREMTTSELLVEYERTKREHPEIGYDELMHNTIRRA